MFDVKHSVEAQKIDLEWASVWRAECKEIHRKSNVFYVKSGGLVLLQV